MKLRLTKIRDTLADFFWFHREPPLWSSDLEPTTESNRYCGWNTTRSSSLDGQGISEDTFYRWKSKYGGMEVHEDIRLRELEQENVRLKKLLAESMLDNVALRDVLQKKVLRLIP